MAEDNAEYIDYLKSFLNLVHPKYGYYVHYPFSGGYYEQPQRTMQIFDIFLGEFRKNLKEQMKNSF